MSIGGRLEYRVPGEQFFCQCACPRVGTLECRHHRIVVNRRIGIAVEALRQIFSRVLAPHCDLGEPLPAWLEISRMEFMRRGDVVGQPGQRGRGVVAFSRCLGQRVQQRVDRRDPRIRLIGHLDRVDHALQSNETAAEFDLLGITGPRFQTEDDFAYSFRPDLIRIHLARIRDGKSAEHIVTPQHQLRERVRIDRQVLGPVPAIDSGEDAGAVHGGKAVQRDLGMPAEPISQFRGLVAHSPQIMPRSAWRTVIGAFDRQPGEPALRHQRIPLAEPSIGMLRDQGLWYRRPTTHGRDEIPGPHLCRIAEPPHEIQLRPRPDLE